MTIAELFVNIAIKGGDAANKTLTGVEKGLGKISSAGIEAKAAVLGALYGLEKLTSAAGRQGQDLAQFAAETGLSVQMLQDWQYAALQAGVSGDEVAGTFKHLNQVIADFRMGKGAPDGSSLLGIDFGKLKSAKELMEALHHAARTLKPDVALNLERNFGISGNMFAMLRRTKEGIAKSPNAFSNKEVDQLAQVNTEWERFFYNMRQDMGHLAAEDGVSAIHELNEAFKGLKWVMGLLRDLTKESDAFKIALGGMAVMAATAFSPLTAVATTLGIILAEMQKRREGKANLIDDMVGFGGGGKGSVSAKLGAGAAFMPPGMKYVMDLMGGQAAGIGHMLAGPGGSGFIGPQTRDQALTGMLKSGAGSGAPGNTSVTINQYGVKLDKPGDVADATKKGLNPVLRQFGRGGE